MMNSLKEEVCRRLAALNPTRLELTDDSAKHAGHAGAKAHHLATGVSEATHLELVIASPAFAGKPLLARHRMVYESLGDLMRTHIHALKIDARLT